MDDVQGVAVVYGLEELFHIECGLCLVKCRVILCCDLIKKGLTLSQLHHQVYILEVIVRLYIVDNVRVVKHAEQLNLVNDIV